MKTILFILLSVLVLTSCKTKNNFNEKLPEIETLVTDQINRADKYFKQTSKLNDGYTDAIEFKKIVSIKGPFQKDGRIPKTYYIIVNVNDITDGQKLNRFFVDIYKEEKNGSGKLVGVIQSLTTIKEAENQIKYHQKYDRWDQYSNYSEYMDRLDLGKLSLESMKNEYSGRYDELGISSDRYNQPSDYYEVIDLHSGELNNIKEDSKEDLKSNNISQKEYDIINRQVIDLLSQLEDFKYTIR